MLDKIHEILAVSKISMPSAAGASSVIAGAVDCVLAARNFVVVAVSVAFA